MEKANITLVLSLTVPSSQEVDGQPRSIEEALHKHGTICGKSIAFTILDNNGKVSQNISYGKNFSYGISCH